MKVPVVPINVPDKEIVPQSSPLAETEIQGAVSVNDAASRPDDGEATGETGPLDDVALNGPQEPEQTFPGQQDGLSENAEQNKGAGEGGATGVNVSDEESRKDASIPKADEEHVAKSIYRMSSFKTGNAVDVNNLLDEMKNASPPVDDGDKEGSEDDDDDVNDDDDDGGGEKAQGREPFKRRNSQLRLQSSLNDDGHKSIRTGRRLSFADDHGKAVEEVAYSDKLHYTVARGGQASGVCCVVS